MKRILVVLGSALVLGGCSGASSGEAPAPPPAPAVTVTATPTPTPTRSSLGEVSSVVELKDAAVAAGYSCPSWDQHNRVTDAAESGSCSDEDVFLSFSSQDARDGIVSFIKAGTGGETLLVGPNWIINATGSEQLTDELGGVVVRAPSD